MKFSTRHFKYKSVTIAFINKVPQIPFFFTTIMRDLEKKIKKLMKNKMSKGEMKGRKKNNKKKRREIMGNQKRKEKKEKENKKKGGERGTVR